MRKFIPLALLLLSTAGGCAKPTPSFVGTWTIKGGEATVYTGNIVLNEDKTSSIKGTVGGVITANIEGTWTANETTFTQTVTSIKFEGLPTGMESMAKQYESGILNVPQTGTFQWKSPDEFVWTRDAHEITFDRVKKS